MGRIFKVTADQLRESEGDAFKYLDLSNGMKPNTGLTSIKACGEDGEGDDANPTITDKAADALSPQAFNRFRMYSTSPRCSSLREGVSVNDKDGDGIDDFYHQEDMDVLSNGSKDDDLTRVPASISAKVEALVSAMSSLSAKQKSMVINRFIEASDLTKLPLPWRKELCMKVMSNSPANNGGK